MTGFLFDLVFFFLPCISCLSSWKTWFLTVLTQTSPSVLNLVLASTHSPLSPARCLLVLPPGPLGKPGFVETLCPQNPVALLPSALKLKAGVFCRSLWEKGWGWKWEGWVEVDTWIARGVPAACTLLSQMLAVVLSCTQLRLQTCNVHIYLCSSCFKLLEEVISFYSSSETHILFCVDVLKGWQDCHSLRVASQCAVGRTAILGAVSWKQEWFLFFLWPVDKALWRPHVGSFMYSPFEMHPGCNVPGWEPACLPHCVCTPALGVHGAQAWGWGGPHSQLLKLGHGYWGREKCLGCRGTRAGIWVVRRARNAL